MTFDAVLFVVLSAVAIFGALIMVTRRHPLSSALALIVVMIALAGLYALADATLLAILQILVYAGAILALVVFVIMLINVRVEDLVYEDGFEGRVGFSLTIAGLLFFAIATAIMRLPSLPFPAVPADFGTLGSVGIGLFRKYWFPFEVVSVVLTVAMVGAVALAQRKMDG